MNSQQLPAILLVRGLLDVSAPSRGLQNILTLVLGEYAETHSFALEAQRLLEPATPSKLPRDIQDDLLNVGRKYCMCAKSLQSWPALCDPMDCSLPGSSVLGTLQAGILEWVAMPSFRESSQSRD